VLVAGAGARARPLDHPPALAQRVPTARTPIDLRQLSDVGDRSIGRSYGVDDTVLIGADVQFHPEVPVATFPGLLHLEVARRTGVLGGTGRRNDGCVHNGPVAQQQFARFQQAANSIQDRTGQAMLFQQMAEAQGLLSLDRSLSQSFLEHSVLEDTADCAASGTDILRSTVQAYNGTYARSDCACPVLGELSNHERVTQYAGCKHSSSYDMDSVMLTSLLGKPRTQKC